MTTRKYSSRSQQTTLTSAVTAGDTTISVVSGTSLLGGVTIPAGTTFTLVIDPDTALEEIVDATAVSTNTFTITRGIDGSSAVEHSAGAAVRHMAIGRDYRDANLHAEADASYNDGSGNAHTMHGIAAGEGVVVGTLKTQTLTNKTLTSPTITDPTITGVVGGASITFEGATADANETTLTVVDPTQDNTITLPNTSGTVVLDSATQTLSNKTLGSNLSAGGFKITNLATPTAASDAVRKDFADAQVAAAASSATAAATSASSAATSASSAATSASSASASATAAATSASSAATSAASAQTFASTMAASVSAAQTSATSAANSATAAASSATAAATSASSASASASAAATSAASASTSASSALASASSAATSASSAANSSNLASGSASSAATSASSAATSASSAATSASSAAASFDEFDDRYLGAKSSPPTVDNDGNVLLTGALYWNTGTNKMYTWSGSAWSEISSTADIITYVYTATASQTSVSGPDDNGLTLSYLVGKEQVYLNGVLLVRGVDYTASTGSSITGLAAMSAGDILSVLAFSAFNVADVVPESTVTTKGDLLVASAASAIGRLGVGSNGQVLVADSTTATGLAWKSYAAQFVAGKNKILNGDFGIWQRGTSFTTGGVYCADRWYTVIGGTTTVSRDTDVPTDPGFNYSIKQLTAAGSSFAQWHYTFESNVVNPLRGKNVIVSYYLKANATWSGSFTANCYYSNSTDARGSQTTSVVTTVPANTPTTTWARYTATFTVPTDAVGLQIQFNPGTAQASGAALWMTGVQLEVGSVATPFSTATGNPASELAACQRYYYRHTPGAADAKVALGFAINTTSANLQCALPTQMRVIPTAVDYGSLNLFLPGVGTYAITGLALSGAAPLIGAINVTGATGLTQWRPYELSTSATTGYIGFSAEL